MSNTDQATRDPRLGWLTEPLSPYQLVTVSVILVGLGSSYCILHGAARSQSVDLSISTSWAVGAVIPFFMMFEVLKRRTQASGIVPSRLVLGVVLANAISFSTVAILVPTPSAWAVELFSRLPINALLIGLLGLGWILRESSARGASPPSETPLPLDVDPSEVRYVRSAGNYVELHAGDRTHLVRTTMGALEERWSNHGFVRIHRSTLVSRACVEAFEHEQGVSWARLATGERLRVSRAYRHRID